jgi:hypothetical protein
MDMDNGYVREISHWAVDHAPCVTFAQVRGLAVKRGMTLRDLVAQFQRDVDPPREVFARVFEKKLDAGVMPYGAAIQWDEKATAPGLSMTGESACACGCGARVRGRRKWVSPGCRKRVQRTSPTSRKVA